MLRLLILSLLIGASPALASPQTPAIAAPLCLHCGEWELYDADRGLIGESIHIAIDRVTIPSIGDFCPQRVETSNRTAEGATVKLALKEAGSCRAPAIDEDIDEPVDEVLTYTLEMRMGKGMLKEASSADFMLRRPRTVDPVFSASGWNLEREGPCDDSGSSGATTCLEHRFADVFKRTAYAAFRAANTVPAPTATRFASSFNFLRFTQRVKSFCDARNKHAGGSRWPDYWSVSCQLTHMQAKLEELDRWHFCVRATAAERWELRPVKRKPCVPPSERFDRALKTSEAE